MTDQAKAEESRPTPHRRFRLVLTGVLVVLLVASGGFQLTNVGCAPGIHRDRRASNSEPKIRASSRQGQPSQADARYRHSGACSQDTRA